ncbi:unnamed protein product [Alopecurus aequalis]
MGGGEEDERVAPRHEMASLPIPDELLAEILLRLPTPADLVRTSAACVSFLRVAAHRSFLRRYRKLHAPPLLGFLDQHDKAFYPATPPYLSASAGSAVALAADFSFSFLPAPAGDWVLRNIRDGRALLERPMRDHNGTIVFLEVVVCDPLHRRYFLLPPIAYQYIGTYRQYSREMFLVSPSEGHEAEETSFRVVSMSQRDTMILASVFSSNTGQWRTISSQCRTNLFAGLPPMEKMGLFCWRRYAYGCFYWLTPQCEESKLLVLDTRTMEFSIVEPPQEASCCGDFAMVEAGEGRLGMFVLEYRGSDLIYFIGKNDGGSSSQWQKVKTISLWSVTSLMGSMGKYLLLYQHGTSCREAGCFTLDIKTFQREKLCTLGCSVYNLHPYSNFPPSLMSSPTVSSGVEKGPEEEMLEQGCAASSRAESPRPG